MRVCKYKVHKLHQRYILFHHFHLKRQFYWKLTELQMISPFDLLSYSYGSQIIVDQKLTMQEEFSMAKI